MAGRRLAEAGEQRKARKILEAAWAANPHPDIAEAYANLRFGNSARDRLARMQKLAGMLPGQLEGALAVARAALDAREFAAARAALAPYVSAPTRRVATLMAEIEEAEHGDEGRVREWMARAMRASGDPAWTADGVVSERWLPVTPGGKLDGFQWRLPLAEIGVSRPVIEAALPAVEKAAPAARRRRSAGRGRRARAQAGQDRCPDRRQERQNTAGRAGDPAGARARRSGPGSASRRRPGAGTDRAVARSLAAIHRAVPLIGPIACQACSAPISEARFQPA